MSTQDKVRWNQRYTQQTYGQRSHPSELLTRWAHLPSTNLAEAGQAWDMACGTGRNLLYLAQQGYAAVGVDVAEVGLAQAAKRLEQAGASADFVAHDLELPQLPPELRATPVLVLVFRYLQLPLLPRLADRLAIGGRLIVEVHLQTDLEVGGPSSARFRAAPGAVREAVLSAKASLAIEHDYEGPVTDPDGSPMALAQLVARREA